MGVSYLSFSLLYWGELSIRIDIFYFRMPKGEFITLHPKIYEGEREKIVRVVVRYLRTVILKTARL